MVGGGTIASWWPGLWNVVAGSLGEKDKLVVVAAGGLGWCSIRTTWCSVALRSHWILLPAVVDGGDEWL